MSASTIPCCMPSTVRGHGLFNEAMKKIAHLLLTGFPLIASTASHLRYQCHNTGHNGAREKSQKQSMMCSEFTLFCFKKSFVDLFMKGNIHLGHERFLLQLVLKIKPASCGSAIRDFNNQHFLPAGLDKMLQHFSQIPVIAVQKVHFCSMPQALLNCLD